MKKIVSVMLMLFASSVYAMDCVYDDNLVAENSVAYSKNYTLDCSAARIDYLSFQAVCSSVTYAPVYITTSAVDTIFDTITTTVSYTTGTGLLFSSSSFTMGGLANGTTYFAIAYATGKIRLASSSANAQNGVSVDLTTGGNSGTFTLKPTPLIGNATFYWAGSNDGVNYVDLKSTYVYVNSATTANTSSLYDFSRYAYRFIRGILTMPSSGNIYLYIRGYAEKVAP